MWFKRRIPEQKEVWEFIFLLLEANGKVTAADINVDQAKTDLVIKTTQDFVKFFNDNPKLSFEKAKTLFALPYAKKPRT